MSGRRYITKSESESEGESEGKRLIVKRQKLSVGKRACSNLGSYCAMGQVKRSPIAIGRNRAVAILTPKLNYSDS